MKRLAGALILGLTLGCSTQPVDEEVSPQPSPQPVVVPTDPRVAEMEVVVGELLDRIEVMNARLQKLEQGQPAPRETTTRRVADATPPPSPAEPRAAAPATERPAGPPLRGAALGEAYRSALELFGKGRLDDARATFQRVYDSDTNGDLADNALYWIAETYFVRARYADAIRIYHQITTDYSDQNKAPDAMLKTGLAQAKLGDLALARRTFEELIAKYPYSTPAAAARHEIKRIQY